MLKWETLSPDAVEAVGLKGIYEIRRTGMLGFTLSGAGWDSLTMLALSPYGRLFDRLDKAKQHAQALERVKAYETQIGGE